MSEQRLTCADCGRQFAFGAEEQRLFREKGFDPPNRCKECRRAKKAQRGHDDRGPPVRSRRTCMHSYSFNLLDAVREAASRFTGEFTSRDMARRVKEEHPDFGLGDSQLVSNYLAVLVREGRLVRVKRPSPRDHVPGMYRNAGVADRAPAFGAMKGGRK